MTDKDAILQEILEYNAQPSLDDDEFTIEVYRGLWESSHGRPLNKSTARLHLSNAVSAGKLTKRMVFHRGYWRVAYKAVKNEEAQEPRS
jgi:hypothetical protein